MKVKTNITLSSLINDATEHSNFTPFKVLHTSPMFYMDGRTFYETGYVKVPADFISKFKIETTGAQVNYTSTAFDNVNAELTFGQLAANGEVVFGIDNAHSYVYTAEQFDQMLIDLALYFKDKYEGRDDI